MKGYEQELARIGLNIRFLRIKNGISQTSFADISGLSVRTISLIERGEIDAKISSLIKISEVLGMTLSELLDFEVK